MARVNIAMLAGSIGQPVTDVVLKLRKAYPAKRVVSLERGSLPSRPKDPLRIEVHYDDNGIVYEVRQG